MRAVRVPKFVLSKMSRESEHCENEFYYPMQNYFSRQLTPKAKKEISSTIMTVWTGLDTPRKWRSLQLSQNPTSKQALKETTFPDKLSDN